MTLAPAILERFRRYGWSEPEGEWGYIQAKTRQSYRDILDSGDEAALETMLAGMFRSRASAGLVGLDYREFDTDEKRAEFTETLTANLFLWAAYTDARASDLALLASPGVGDPMVGEIDGVDVMLETPRHDHYAERLCALLPAGGTVLEIGGGYGGAALQVMRRSDNIQVVLIDLPETLYLAWHFLSEATLDRSVGWWDEGPRADVVLLPVVDLYAFTGPGMLPQHTVAFAAHSLSEMSKTEVLKYRVWIDSMRPRYFYHDNAHAALGRKEGDDRPLSTAEEYGEVLSSDIALGPPYREVYRAPTVWPLTGGRYWEFCYEREAT